MLRGCSASRLRRSAGGSTATSLLTARVGRPSWGLSPLKAALLHRGLSLGASSSNEAGHLAAYRQQQRMPSRRLRKYVSSWRGSSDVPYPLARRKPCTGPGPLVHADFIDADSTARAAARSVAAFFDRVDYDGDVPVRYWPDGRDAHIVLDPRRQFGSPIIEGTRMGTEVIYGMNTAGDPAEWLAHAYSLDLVQVEAAIRFEQRLANRKIIAYQAA